MTREPKLFPYIARLLQGAEVVWKPLGEVTEYEQPTAYLVKSTNYKDTYPTPVLTAGKTFILGYTDETDGIYQASLHPVIIFDDFTTAHKWVDFDFKAKSSAMKMIISKDESQVLLRYIYHWLNTLPSELAEGDHKRQWISNFSNKKIPLPPLPVQQEIVRILDKFTTLEAELEAELEARKKQYEYYRNELLKFENIEEMGWRKLGDLCDFQNGFAFKSTLFKDSGLPIIRITNITGSTVDCENIQFFDPADYKKENPLDYIVEKGDILIAMSGATTGKIGYYDYDEKAYLNQRVGKFIPRRELLNNRYLYHFLQTRRSLLYTYAGGGAQPNLSSNDLKNKLMIPIPYPNDTKKSLEEQARIVAILDRFDTLVNSISEGLPKEIALRRKQYEYYREQLLSFPKR